MRFTRLLGALLITVLLLTNQAQATIFQGLGDLPGGTFQSIAYGISNDGTTVVGYSSAYYSSSLNRNEAFRWTSVAGISGLGVLPGAADGFSVSLATGVSADGSVVVGSSNSGSGYQAFRWDSTNGMVGLGGLPGSSVDSKANSVSANGSVVVGTTASAEGTQAFRWTESGGMIGLGALPGSDFYSDAHGVSADGSVVVGISKSSQSGTNEQAFRWTQSGGMVGLGDLPGGIFASSATAVSANGSFIVGQGYNDAGAQAFRWTAASGMVGLGALPDGYESYATGVSADGSVVVGQSRSFSSGYKAFIWTQAHGMQSVEDLLSSTYGVDLTGWTLIEATGISADGKTIVGYGINPIGQYEAWIASINPVPIIINIKPGDDTNKINVRSGKTVPVAILSSTNFDALLEVDADRMSLTFGPTGDEQSLLSCEFRRPKDVNGDGLKDLVCQFSIMDTGFECGDVEGLLKGVTVTGTPFEGSQDILIIPCK